MHTITCIVYLVHIYKYYCLVVEPASQKGHQRVLGSVKTFNSRRAPVAGVEQQCKKGKEVDS